MNSDAAPIHAEPPAPALPAPPADPLTAEHRAALDAARAQRRKIDFAVGVATFNGWSMAVCAALSAPFALFSLTGAIVCVGLIAVAYQEFRGRGLLRQLDPRGPRLLGCNQLTLLALLIVYCLWSFYRSLGQTEMVAAQLAGYPELTQIVGSIEDLVLIVAAVLYGSVIVFSAIFQGATAAYYFSRSRHLRAYLDQTPAWIVELQRRSEG